MIISDLRDTVTGMTSGCYKERLRAEYHQLKIRTEELRAMVIKYREGTLDFTPICSLGSLENHLDAMERRISRIELRAEIEKVTL